jgi:hypothetical protein
LVEQKDTPDEIRSNIMTTGTQKTTPETFGTMGRKAGDQAKNLGEKAGEQAKSMGERVGEQAKNFGEKVGDQAKNFGEQARNIGDKVSEGAHTAAQTAVETMQNTGAFVGDKAEQATSAVGRGMESLGSTIREHAPREGMMHTAGEKVAESLESGGRYLEEHHLREIGNDLTNLIRRNPIPALLLGIGVGFLLARAIRS